MFRESTAALCGQAKRHDQRAIRVVEVREASLCVLLHPAFEFLDFLHAAELSNELLDVQMPGERRESPLVMRRAVQATLSSTSSVSGDATRVRARTLE
jgi:hypothetical protein